MSLEPQNSLQKTSKKVVKVMYGAASIVLLFIAGVSVFLIVVGVLQKTGIL